MGNEKTLGVCKIKPSKPRDKSNQCLRWPPTYTGHLPLQEGAITGLLHSTQHQTSSRKADGKERKLLLVLGAAWRCHPALSGQAETVPALNRAVAGDCAPVWEAEGWQQWLLPCSGKSDHAAGESARAFCSPPVWSQGNLRQREIKAQTTLQSKSVSQ